MENKKTNFIKSLLPPLYYLTANENLQKKIDQTKRFSPTKKEKNSIRFKQPFFDSICKLPKISDESSKFQSTSSFYSDLTSQQKSIVSHISTPLLVIGNAGTGKTYTLIKKLNYLLDEGLSPSEILLISPQDYNYKEIIDGIEAHHVLPDESPFSGTLLRFAIFCLRKYAKQFEIVTEIELDDDYETFVLYDNSINLNLDIYKNPNRLLHSFRKGLIISQRFKKAVQKHARHVLVDEFENITDVEAEIFHILMDYDNSFTIFADDAQSIFAYNLGNLNNLIELPNSFEKVMVAKLNKNFRSSPQIINAVNDILNSRFYGLPISSESEMPDGIKPVISRFTTPLEEARFIADKIFELQKSGTELHEMAILLRSKWSAYKITPFLSQFTIEYSFDSPSLLNIPRDVQKLLTSVQVITQPSNEVAWLRLFDFNSLLEDAFSSGIWNILIKNKGILTSDDVPIYDDQYWHLYSLLDTVSKIRKKANTPTKLIRTLNGSGPLLIFSHHFEREYDFILLEAKKYSDLNIFSNDIIAHYFEKYRKYSKVNPLQNKGHLTICSIHESKSHEWHTVFMPHLLDGIIPDHRSREEYEKIEEERRVFYTGITRAKQNLYLTLPKSSGRYPGPFTHPSQFLKDIKPIHFNIL